MIKLKDGICILKQSDARIFDLRHKRGIRAQLIDGTIGAKNVDFHINTIYPNEAEGLTHYHNIRENVYFVLEGKIFVKTAEGKFVVEAGEMVFIPALTKHTVWNAGDVDARLIEIYAPVVENDFVEAQD